MSFIRKVLGPLLKYDKSLPYTYMVKAAPIEGEEGVEFYKMGVNTGPPPPYKKIHKKIAKRVKK